MRIELISIICITSSLKFAKGLGNTPQAGKEGYLSTAAWRVQKISRPRPVMMSNRSVPRPGTLPEPLDTALPTIEAIEEELSGDLEDGAF